MTDVGLTALVLYCDVDRPLAWEVEWHLRALHPYGIHTVLADLPESRPASATRRDFLIPSPREVRAASEDDLAAAVDAARIIIPLVTIDLINTHLDHPHVDRLLNAAVDRRRAVWLQLLGGYCDLVDAPSIYRRFQPVNTAWDEEAPLEAQRKPARQKLLSRLARHVAAHLPQEIAS